MPAFSRKAASVRRDRQAGIEVLCIRSAIPVYSPADESGKWRKTRAWKRAGIGFFCLLCLVFTSLHSHAADKMAFRQEIIRNVRSGAQTWANCGSVTIVPPAKGYVVVTASGMAFFDTDFSDLSLTLATKSARRGSWVYGVTPGFQLVQNYTVRSVFAVKKDRSYTFYLNGISANGPGRHISVQTGSITAEFYKGSNVHAQEVPEEDSALLRVKTPSDLRSNAL